MNKQSNLSRLMSYAGAHKYLTYASWILSALSSLVALIPFWYIWQIIREVLRAGHDPGQRDSREWDGLPCFLLCSASWYTFAA